MTLKGGKVGLKLTVKDEADCTFCKENDHLNNCRAFEESGNDDCDYIESCDDCGRHYCTYCTHEEGCVADDLVNEIGIVDEGEGCFLGFVVQHPRYWARVLVEDSCPQEQIWALIKMQLEGTCGIFIPFDATYREATMEEYERLVGHGRT